MRADYNDYIHSDKWLERRRQTLLRDGFRCQKCGSRRFLHVHHLTYARFGNEKLEDLQTVCKECHETIHGRKMGWPKRKKRIKWVWSFPHKRMRSRASLFRSALRKVMRKAW